MRSVSRSLFRILNSEKIAPVQFLDLQLPGSTAASTLHFTDFGQPITWAGNPYVPISLSRGGIEEIISSEQGESPQSTLTVSNIDLQMADLLNRVELVGAYATLWLADRRPQSPRSPSPCRSFSPARSFLFFPAYTAAPSKTP